jgi:hypothetical protein
MPLNISGANVDIDIKGNLSDIGGKQKTVVKEGSDNNVRNTTTNNTSISDSNNNSSVKQSIGQNLYYLPCTQTLIFLRRGTRILNTSVSE